MPVELVAVAAFAVGYLLRRAECRILWLVIAQNNAEIEALRKALADEPEDEVEALMRETAPWN